MKRDQSGLFWMSYADLMTALFILTLTLFVLSYKLFKVHETDLFAAQAELRLREHELDQQQTTLLAQQADLEAQRKAAATFRQRWSEEEVHVASLVDELNAERQRLSVMEEEYRKLQEIQKAIENLDPRYFTYQAKFKRHVLHPQVKFDKGSVDITGHYRPMLVAAGQALKRLADRLEPGDNVKYLLVIEGMSSKDRYRKNYELSYERALSLYRLWQEEGIDFDPNRFEIMISGSGSGGVGRDPRNEANNQRFLIQVIPKIGNLELMDFS